MDSNEPLVPRALLVGIGPIKLAWIESASNLTNELHSCQFASIGWPQWVLDYYTIFGHLQKLKLAQ